MLEKATILAGAEDRLTRRSDVLMSEAEVSDGHVAPLYTMATRSHYPSRAIRRPCLTTCDRAMTESIVAVRIWSAQAK
jgi:hypothetical protein